MAVSTMSPGARRHERDEDGQRLQRIAQHGREDAGAEQEQHDDTAELVDGQPPQRSFRHVPHAVRADIPQASRGFLFREPGIDGCSQQARGLRRRECMPR
jgi:hypothetical protein